MSHVQTNIRLHIDHTKSTKCDMMGMKLDKSKCFDRIVPKIAAAILIGLGVPASVVLVYIQMYEGLQKHLAYKQWISPIATTSANGTIQGCSFSLLAVNALMCGWTRLVHCIPNIYMASFIDDSYLWRRAENSQALEAALQVTTLWDNLTGQHLNKKKSEVWATSPTSRRQAKTLFPELSHVNVVVVLGARIQTTEKLSYNWDEAKTDKIRREISLIRALPCSRDMFTQLISTKVIPQFTFASLLNAVPKKVLTAIQSDIADCLWKDRPLWRSRFLLLGLFSKPHRIEPFLARAFTAICECITFLKTCKPEFREIWEQQAEANQVSCNSNFMHFLQALEVFGIELPNAFTLKIHGVELNMIDLALRDFKRVLIQIARTMCYRKASGINRKDFHKSDQFLDFESTMYTRNLLKKQNSSLVGYCESVLVGCTITQDRAYRANLAPDNLCRFCDAVQESMYHVTAECPCAPFKQDQPEWPKDFGKNLMMLGIVEAPPAIVSQRFKISNPWNIPVVPWHSSTTTSLLKVWTDGSCDNNHLFWYTSGSYAVIFSGGIIAKTGIVYHIVMSSYTCEMWALLEAFCSAEQPIFCYTDCQTLVKHVRFLITTKPIDFSWPHLER